MIRQVNTVSRKLMVKHRYTLGKRLAPTKQDMRDIMFHVPVELRAVQPASAYARSPPELQRLKHAAKPTQRSCSEFLR